MKISIITVNYNDKIGLQKTIDSVITQTWKEFEFIVIDGNSNDGSKEIIANHEKDFTYSVSEADRGIYHAMNKGIKVAKGEYLLFLNSADILKEENTLRNLIGHLESGKQIYYGDVIYQETNKQRERMFPDELSFLFFIETSLSHQATFIKRELFDSIFLYNEDYKIVSDWEFFVYAICKANVSYERIPQFVTIYDTTGVSSREDNHPLMYAERDLSLNQHFPAFVKDYENVAALGSKRAKQFLWIRQHNIAWKILKGFLSLTLVFLPTQKNK